ncbi:hypothetical protein [Kribbella sp. NPDC051770]|uniref:hypothetical protein n=1 Tax=Kribbella sp. NPDC051770 TaxID=3155413 RepID=UPI003430AEA8
MTTPTPSADFLRKEASEIVHAVAFRLFPVVTGLGLLLMPRLVGADWPGWSSTMVMIILVVIPAAFVMTMISARTSRLARWIAALAVIACVARMIWSLYDAGDRAAFAVIALTPFLLLLGAAVLLIAYSWPRATTRDLAIVAQANGWQVHRDLPNDLRLPAAPLPLPIGRTWVVRNVVRTSSALAFEVRWLEWHGLLCRRQRLTVFVGRQLQQELPALEVRPGRGLTRSDLSLESAEFNRAYDVIGDHPQYLMAMLQPRVMQTLLDARPIGLVVDRDVLLAYDDAALTAESLRRGITAVERLTELVPQHVYDQWGRRHPFAPTAKLRFAGPGWSHHIGKLYLRWLALSTGLLGLTLAACLAGAAAESHVNGTAFNPTRPLSSLLTAVVVLWLIATISGIASRPRLAHGSASA